MVVINTYSAYHNKMLVLNFWNFVLLPEIINNQILINSIDFVRSANIIELIGTFLRRELELIIFTSKQR